MCVHVIVLERTFRGIHRISIATYSHCLHYTAAEDVVKEPGFLKIDRHAAEAMVKANPSVYIIRESSDSMKHGFPVRVVFFFARSCT